MKASAGDLNKGSFIEHKNDIYQIVKIDHNFRGRGSANLKMKIKNVSNGNTLTETFKPDTTVEQVDVESTQMQFLYGDDDELTFMNENTYEQVQVPTAAAESFKDYLPEGQKVYIAMHGDTPLTVIPPQKVTLEVTEAHDAVKGDTAQGAKKSVTVETGASINVPLFIKKGEKIVVNPETGEYVERG